MARVVIDTGEAEAGTLLWPCGSVALTLTVKEPATVKAWLAMTAEALLELAKLWSGLPSPQWTL
jgi:hypothetical protein